MRAPRAVAAATGVCFLTSCTTTYTIPPLELQYLNGYSIHSEQTVNGDTFTDVPYRLISTDGQPVDYNSTKQLHLLGSAGQPLAPFGPFHTIFMGEDSLDVVPVRGPPVQVPLQAISKVEIQQPDPGGTAWVLTLALTLVSVALSVPFLVDGSDHSSGASAVAAAKAHAAK